MLSDLVFLLSSFKILEISTASLRCESESSALSKLFHFWREITEGVLGFVKFHLFLHLFVNWV